MFGNFKNTNSMKLKLTLLLYSSISFVFASDYVKSEILSSAYNSVGIAVVESFGDVEASGTGITFTYKPTPINIIFNYTTADSDIDEILGLSVFDVEAEADTFQLGYLIERDGSSHLIPFISTGSLEYSYLGYNIEADTTSFGFLLRSFQGENTVFTFGLEYVDYDDMTVPSATRSAINTALNNIGYTSLSDADFNSIENTATSSTTIFSLGIEYHVTGNMIIDYGLATDFDNTSLSFGIGLKY